jgi:hypothetical protein
MGGKPGGSEYGFLVFASVFEDQSLRTEQSKLS